jgi:hypothetical protein
MNSNSYLLSYTGGWLRPMRRRTFGAGPGPRFIDGTFAPHVKLEARIARLWPSDRTGVQPAYDGIGPPSHAEDTHLDGDASTIASSPCGSPRPVSPRDLTQRPRDWAAPRRVLPERGASS